MPKRKGPGRPKDTWLKKAGKWLKKNKVIVLVFTVLFALGLNIFFWRHGVSQLKSSFADNYVSSKTTTSEMVEKRFYDTAYEYYESKYHTADRLTINVDSLKELSNLEVLRVSDVQYVIDNSSTNDEHVTAWLKVPGHSVFSVDLSLSEFIIDNARGIITIRLPKPELDNFTIDYDAVEILKYKDGFLNESLAYGAALARQQLATASEEMRADFAINQKYIESAKSSAEKHLKQFVRELNPELSEENIYIEFDS